MKTLKRKTLLSKLPIFIISLLLIGYGWLQYATPYANSYANKPPAGLTGSPGNNNQTCTACHSSSVSTKTGWITSNIPASGYVPGTTYTITGTATYAGRNTFGFEISPQDIAGNILGTVINTSSQTAILATGYIGQTSSGLSGSGSKSWSFDWVAPSAGTGPVTFYGVFNCANGNGGDSGDIIYKSTLTVQEAASANDDAGIKNILYPVSQACSTNISPQVTLQNYGSNTLTSVVINYQIDGGTVNTYSWSGSLATNSTEVVALPSITTTNGSHTFSVYTTSPNGATDGNSANDMANSNFSVVMAQSLPFSEGFENASFPPSGWSVIDPDAAATDNATWARTTSAASLGSAAVKLDIYNANAINGQHDALQTPPVSLSSVSSATLTFDVAYTYYTSPFQYSDTLKVWVSSDCGVTYNQEYIKWGDNLKTAPATTNAFTPTSGQWRTETIDLSSYLGNDVIVKFECVNDWENNMYLDNINIDGLATAVEDVAMKNDEILVYPNPSTGIINISAKNKISSIKIYSHMGKIVKNYGNLSNQHQLDLSLLSKGVYFISILSNDKTTTSKIVLTN